MLALSRRVGEKVLIGDPANPLGEIQVVAVQGDRVRLAFDFPQHVAINRSELADRKRGGEPDSGRPSGSPPPH